MATTTASVRELRNQFPRVKKLVEQEGTVLITDQGTPRYRLTLYTPPRRKRSTAKDYLARVRRHQPRPITASAAKALHELNRGER
jgi:antitoxin (DNA-binding transcriptional repressor) of toxin-antitoxin stability system